MAHDDVALASANTLNRLLATGELMPIKTAARLAGYTTMGVRKIAERGCIQDIRVGRACFVLRSELETYLAERRGQ